MGLRCHKSDKNRERFAITSRQSEMLVNCPRWIPKCFTHKPIVKYHIFHTGCIRFSSQFQNFHNREQGLRFMAEMEQPSNIANKHTFLKLKFPSVTN